MNDAVNHPAHYTAHASGLECIELSEHLDFCLGNALKYLWRAGQKSGSSYREDVAKAVWYIRRFTSKNDAFSLVDIRARFTENAAKVLVTEEYDSHLAKFLIAMLSVRPHTALCALVDQLRVE